MSEIITYQSIGIIHTPFTEIENMPVQPSGAKGIKGIVELKPQFIKGLKDLEGFSYIILVYHFHEVKNSKLSVIPFMDTVPHGIFATRSPVRPNAIGISTVKLLHIENSTLQIEDIDVLNGTPLIDIKPFYPMFDNRICEKTGWLQGKENLENIRSDNRFINL